MLHSWHQDGARIWNEDGYRNPVPMLRYRCYIAIVVAGFPAVAVAVCVSRIARSLGCFHVCNFGRCGEIQEMEFRNKIVLHFRTPVVVRTRKMVTELTSQRALLSAKSGYNAIAVFRTPGDLCGCRRAACFGKYDHVGSYHQRLEASATSRRGCLGALSTGILNRRLDRRAEKTRISTLWLVKPDRPAHRYITSFH